MHAKSGCSPHARQNLRVLTCATVEHVSDGTHIRITSVPTGEAPCAKNGLVFELPTLGPARAGRNRTVGTVTGPISRLGLLVAFLRGRSKKTTAYLVSGEAALMALTEVSPEAAACRRQCTKLCPLRPWSGQRLHANV
jgi:hypothetical protein